MAEILIIHDQAPLRQQLLEQVRAADHVASGAIDLQQARAHAASRAAHYAVVLIGIPKGERVGAAITQVKHEWPAADVVVIGQSHDLSDATEAVRQGAYEYVPAPVELTRLTHVLHNVASRWLGPEPRIQAVDPQSEAVPSIDPAMQALFVKADRAAAVNSTVLITGESGTGKEVLARRIHRLSARRHCSFVPVNSAGLLDTLVETELFGYRKGAFTGAVADSKGLIDEAKGGVLFLDEIGDMPLSIQVRLLRFLDSGEVRAVGGTSIKHVDVRVIAATNRSLPSEIREKRFREDLFFRLSIISLHLPALRNRRCDIPALVHHHVRRLAAKLGVPVPTVSPDAMSLLLRYDWPGNIRELQNALEQALVQVVDRRLTPRELPLAVQHGSLEPMSPVSRDRGPGDHDTLVNALRQHHGNHAEAAASLGISRTTLWRRLRQLNGSANGTSAE